MMDTFSTFKKMAIGEESSGNTLKKVALGDQTAVASAAGPSAQDVAKQLSSEVSAFLAATIDRAWSKLAEEFEVQKLVWDSKAVSKKGMGTEEQNLKEQFEALLRERQNQAGGLERIGQIRKNHSGRISASLLDVLMEITAQVGLADKRNALANRLAAAGDPATLPQTESEKGTVEKLVASCKLEKTLGRKVREALKLPALAERTGSKEAKKGIVMEDFKPLVIATPSRALYEVVGMEAAAERKGSAKLGGAVGAKPTFSNTSLQSGKAPREADWQPLGPEAAANRLRAMAMERPPAAWKKLATEYETQQLVWESCAASKQKNSTIANQIVALKASFERIVSLISESEEIALGALKDLLGKADDVKLLSKSLEKTCRDVLKQHSAKPHRLALAEKVKVDSVPAASRDIEKKELEALLVKCALNDDQLNYSVRQCLLLSLPEELEAMLAASLMMRQASRGSKASRADSKASGATASRKDPIRRDSLGSAVSATASLGLAASATVTQGAEVVACI